MDALAELSAEQGYEATKISDIVKRAGVARKTLYDNFEGKEEVFLAAFDAARDEVVARVERAALRPRAGGTRSRPGWRAFLGYIAEEPVLARMCMIEALSATPAATKRYEDAMQTFVDMAGDNLPQDERMPDTIEETLVGGVSWIVYQQIRRAEAEQRRGSAAGADRVHDRSLSRSWRAAISDRGADRQTRALPDFSARGTTAPRPSWPAPRVRRAESARAAACRARRVPGRKRLRTDHGLLDRQARRRLQERLLQTVREQGRLLRRRL